MKKTLIINQKEVRELLKMDQCIQAMEECFKDVSTGATEMLQRTMIHHPNGNILAGMASSLHNKSITGSKVIIFPGTETKKAGTNQGIVPIFDIATGALVTIVDGEIITGVRTAAATAAATGWLARGDASSLAILGAGNLGRLHVDSIKLVRDIRRVTVWDINPEATEALCNHIFDKYSMEVVPCATAQQAVEGADIICTMTKASTPILKGAWIKPGAHVNAIGACSAKVREVDTETVLKSRVYCDKVEAVLRDAGDLLIPMEEGALTPDHIVGEIGNVMLGKLGGRQSAEEITMFETVGIAVEDLAAAWLVYQQAREKGMGVEVEI